MSEKELNDFEANIVLRRALALQKINIEDDPHFAELQAAKWEKEMTKYALTAFGSSMNLLILYSFRYKKKLPWASVIGRMTTVARS